MRWRPRAGLPAPPTARLPRAGLAGFAWFVLVLCAPYACAAGDPQLAHVVSVADGDSMVVMLTGERMQVRLAEIDAPERGQPWNARARQALREKVMDQRVRLVTVDIDRYGRTVAHVWLGERHVNRELVREGHAWVYLRYLRDATLPAEQADARAARRGLWSMPDPVEPWRWRERQRRQRVE